MRHDNINMSQDISINNIATAPNITQTITNTDVLTTYKENAKNKSDIENRSNTIQNRLNQMKILNLKENRS